MNKTFILSKNGDIIKKPDSNLNQTEIKFECGFEDGKFIGTNTNYPKNKNTIIDIPILFNRFDYCIDDIFYINQFLISFTKKRILIDNKKQKISLIFIDDEINKMINNN